MTAPGGATDSVVLFFDASGVAIIAETHSLNTQVPISGLVHIAIVYDHVTSARNAMYLNGDEVAIRQASRDNKVNTELPKVGRVTLPLQDTANFTVHSMALFDRELNETEIANLFNANVPPSLPVFPSTLVLDGIEDTDVVINATLLQAQSSDPSASLHGIEIISKRANDTSPAGVVTLPAMSQNYFTLVPEPGVSTYEPSKGDTCGVTADSEYVVYEISTVPAGCDDGAENLCRVSSALSICLTAVDDPAIWESPSVSGLTVAFNKWSPLTGLVPKDDDGSDLTVLLAGNPTFDLGYTEGADCTDAVVTIPKNGATAATFPQAALDKPLCLKTANAFPESSPALSGTVNLKETDPVVDIDASFAATVDFPYSLTSAASVAFNEDDSPMLLAIVAADSRAELTNGYKFKLTALPAPTNNEYFWSTSSNASILDAKVNVGDVVDATSATIGAPKLDLYLHAVPHFFTTSDLTVEFVVSNGDETIPDSMGFAQSLSIAEVPDFVELSHDVTTTAVYLEAFTPIPGISVLDVDPVPRILNVSVVVVNGGIKYVGAALEGRDCSDYSVECAPCMFNETGCNEVDMMDTSVALNKLFDGLALGNDELGSVSVLVTLRDAIPNEPAYEHTLNITFGGFAAPTASPTYMPTVSPSYFPTTSPTLSPSLSPTVTLPPTQSPSNSPSTASPTKMDTGDLGAGLLIGVTAGPLVLFAAVAGFVFWRRRRNHNGGVPKTALSASLHDIESDGKSSGSGGGGASGKKAPAAPKGAAKSKKRFQPRLPRGPRPTNTSEADLVPTDINVFDWEKHIDKDSGDVYFFNPKTGATRWTAPGVEVTQVKKK
jgi:hypothetical protein